MLRATLNKNTADSGNGNPLDNWYELRAGISYEVQSYTSRYRFMEPEPVVKSQQSRE